MYSPASCGTQNIQRPDYPSRKESSISMSSEARDNGCSRKEYRNSKSLLAIKPANCVCGRLFRTIPKEVSMPVDRLLMTIARETYFSIGHPDVSSIFSSLPHSSPILHSFSILISIFIDSNIFPPEICSSSSQSPSSGSSLWPYIVSINSTRLTVWRDGAIVLANSIV